MSLQRERGELRSRRARRSGITGARSEWLAILWLAAKGYRLLARRFGGKGGEIDLIVKRGRTVAFVEVKARRAMDEAMIAITPDKRRLVEARIRQWLAQNPWAMDHHLRADAVFLAPRRWPRHVPDVFELVL
ncbi:YraN family protein [Bosea sp. (in: a-proteobacteria)]|uniref:YraN family protein n=1 Tax=Bosea sp. (in: a-proteobacteria) TaxID=1871050 RepID=UPI003561A966